MRHKAISRSAISSRTAIRFWTHVDTSNADGCWPWTGATFRKGYGNFHVPQRGNIGAHIVAFLLMSRSNLTLEPQDCVLHVCDNPPCCKYAHLFLGSKKDNTRDMIRKGRDNFKGNIRFAHGRAPKGEAHHKAKLSTADVWEIRRERVNGVSQRQLAAKYGVRRQTIQAIEHGRSWGHLTKPLGAQTDENQGEQNVIAGASQAGA